MNEKFDEVEKIIIEDALRCYISQRVNIGEKFNGLEFLYKTSNKILEKVNKNMEE